jgi:hypothetical protein
MRWGPRKFALFAVVVAATATFAAPMPGHAAIATTTSLSWQPKPTTPPTGVTNFFVRVESGSTRPSGSVTLYYDGAEQTPVNLKDDPDRPRGSITEHDIKLDLGTGPHFFLARYKPDPNSDYTFSEDRLGIATAALTADPEPSVDGDLVTYEFTLTTSAATPAQYWPDSPVFFADDQGHQSEPPPRVTTVDSTHFHAIWRVAQSPFRRRTTALYQPNGDDVFLPVQAIRDHNVNQRPSGGGSGTTQRASTGTTRGTVPKKTPTTAALGPIAPSSTALAPETSTQETFGEFPTIPPTSGNATALSDSNKKDGPPLAVVVMTLGALGVLGAAGAVRRYRRPPSNEWF